MSTRGRLCLIVAALSSTAACDRPTPDAAPSVTATPVDAGAVSTSTSAPTTSAPTTVPATTPATTPESTLPADSTVPPTSATPTTVPATTAPPSTAPTTTEPSGPLTPADLILAFDGVQPFDFGSADTEVVPALAAVLGEPASDVVAEYPTPDEGQFVNDDEMGFVARFGRTVCFDNGLCVEFGAGSDSALQFVGWDFSGEEAAGLATADGITVGSSWADHVDAIVADEGGCFSIGYGSADGVDVTLESNGAPFVETVDGEFVTNDPDPADVRVIGLQAGDVPIQLFADC